MLSVSDAALSPSVFSLTTRVKVICLSGNDDLEIFRRQ